MNLSVLNLSGNEGIQDLPPEMGLLTRLWNLNTRSAGNYSLRIRKQNIIEFFYSVTLFILISSLLNCPEPITENQRLIVYTRIMFIVRKFLSIKIIYEF